MQPIATSRPVHFLISTPYRNLRWLTLPLLIAIALNSTLVGARAQSEALIVKTNGVVKLTRAKIPNSFDPAPEGTSLYPEDIVRTLATSTAVVQMQRDGTQVKMWQNSTLQIMLPEQKTTWMRLKEGALYFFSRGGSTLAKTPHATAGHKGTEFVLTVTPEKTTMVVLDGEGFLTNDLGSVDIRAHEAAIVISGHAPEKSRIEATNLVQWWLFYPAVLDVSELHFAASEAGRLSASIQSYLAGDLPDALHKLPGYPSPPLPESDDAKIYVAALYLAQGDIQTSENLLKQTSQNLSQARALRLLIDAVQRTNTISNPSPSSASEWLGISYYLQSRDTPDRLPRALDAANKAVTISPRFAFAWERIAELEFGFGHTQKSIEALNRSLKLAPKNAQSHALQGFLSLANGNTSAAQASFEHAMKLDGHLGNAWLGRALVRIRKGDVAGASDDMKVAVMLEPNRSLLRSYLGKVLAEARKGVLALEEFDRARGLDASDPTPWLYSALEKRDLNQINSAVTNLETSIRLNDNRAVYRSHFLLEQDLAVRSANLAAIYADAGMTQVSVNEAGKAVTTDYGNYSAHLFLANSYNESRDPNLLTLRYETAAFSEYLIANLLSPAGGTKLSPYVSQQEYSKLFERDGFGFSSGSTYLSHGDWVENVAQYGSFNGTAYAIDGYYRTQHGEVNRLNDYIQQSAISLQLKHDLTPHDSLYGQVISTAYNSGDVRQLYDPRFADANEHVVDSQVPNLFLGYHHEWSPGMHSLLFFGRLHDRFSLYDRNVSIPAVVRDNSGNIVNTVEGALGPGTQNFENVQLHSSFNAYTAEAQQIAQSEKHTVTGGARFQTGTVKNSDGAVRRGGDFPPYGGGFGDFTVAQDVSDNLTRLSLYAYDQWRVVDSLWLVGGLSYDALRFPANVNSPPLSNDERSLNQLSPKAGLIWVATTNTTIRSAYTRSVGGLFYDSSVRIEPVQIAGFNQAYRSLIPESVAGAIPGSKFETLDFTIEQKFKSQTYVTMSLQLLKSRAHQDFGAFDFDVNGVLPTTTLQLGEDYRFRESSMMLSFDQLVGRDWAFGANYRLSEADLQTSFPNLPPAGFAPIDHEALLQNLELHSIFNHATGFYGEAQAIWHGQNNYHADGHLADDDFWQFNLFAGYRFPRRQAELTIGLLNVTDQDYHLNPLNIHRELPHERTLSVTFKLNL